MKGIEKGQNGLPFTSLLSFTWLIFTPLFRCALYIVCIFYDIHPVILEFNNWKYWYNRLCSVGCFIGIIFKLSHMFRPTCGHLCFTERKFLGWADKSANSYTMQYYCFNLVFQKVTRPSDQLAFFCCFTACRLRRRRLHFEINYSPHLQGEGNTST